MTLNSSILDATLRHEVGLHRLTNGTVRRIIALLNAAIPELEAKIRERIGWIAARGYDGSPFTLQRLEANLRVLRQVLAESYSALGKELRGELARAASYEAQFQTRLLATKVTEALRVDIGFGAPNPETLRAIVNTRPFQGGLLRDWSRQLALDAYKNVRKAVRQGLVQGESIDQIVRRIRGTRGKGYADGVLEISRRDAERVVRTATSHVMNHAKESVYAANEDVIKGVQWVATLDSRVCTICGPRDGLQYDLNYRPVGHSVPWLEGPGRAHFGCRCTSVPVLKSWRELGINAREIEPGMRRTADGLVPDRKNFADWIQGQSVAVQNDVLGRFRATQMRAGKLDWSDLFDDKGTWLTLDELKLRDAA